MDRVVFLSHSSADADAASALCERLETSGVQCWIAPRDIEPGSDYSDKIVRGLEASSALVVLLSEPALRSPNVRNEVEMARNAGKHVYPVRLVDVPLSGGLHFFLATSQYIDLFDDSRGDPIERLIETLSSGLPSVRLRDDAPDPESPNPDKSSTAHVPVGPADAVPLPLQGVALILLPDDRTAIVGGDDGRMAAIDIVSGELLDVVQAEETGSRPGGGENSYVGDFFFFLEPAIEPDQFHTMSHSGLFKTWRFDEKFMLVRSSELLADHYEVLNEHIIAAIGGRGWSTWTVYNSGQPDTAPSGIVEAKLAPDRRSVLCLTSWFAIYRCNLAGRLIDGPLVLGDAFNVEPANEDSSRFWVGFNRSVGARNYVSEHSFRDGGIHGAAPARASFGGNGIFALDERRLYAGGAVVDRSDLTDVDHADLSFGAGHAPTIVRDEGLVLAPITSMIAVYDLSTLRVDGPNLIDGHEGEVRRVQVAKDRTRCVSISERSLRVWDLKRRCPIGGYDRSGAVVRHHVIGNYSESFRTANGMILFPGYENAIALVDVERRRALRLTCPEGAEPFAVTVADGETLENARVLGLGSRPAKIVVRAPGILGRVLKREIDTRRHLLRQYRVVPDSLVASGEAALGTPESRLGGRCEPHASNTTAVDLGHGRVAILTAGHLLIYQAHSRSIVSGPIDVSGPETDDVDSHASWTYYTQLALSPDGNTLFVRGKDLPIALHGVPDLALVRTLDETCGRPGLLVPWLDSRHVLFTVQAKSDAGHSGSRLMVADALEGRLVGKLRDLEDWYLPTEPASVSLIDEGRMLAMATGNSVRLVSLLDDEDPDSLELHSGGIGALTTTSDGRCLVTVSVDGTCKYTEIDSTETAADTRSVTSALLERVSVGSR